MRRFNRTVSQRVGALNDRYLARDRPLGESRLLWEIGEQGCEVRTLRARLDLDSGYVSRLLRSLEAGALIEVGPSEHDRRVRRARLTKHGVGERTVLDRRSDALAWSMLEPLDEAQRQRLVAAMDEVFGCSPRRWSRLIPSIPLTPTPNAAWPSTSPSLTADSMAASIRREASLPTSMRCGPRRACSSSPSHSVMRSVAARSSFTPTPRPSSNGCGSTHGAWSRRWPSSAR